FSQHLILHSFPTRRSSDLNLHRVRVLHQPNILVRQMNNPKNLRISFQKNHLSEKYPGIILSNHRLKTTDKSRIESQSNWEFPSLHEFWKSFYELVFYHSELHYLALYSPLIDFTDC